MLAINPMYYGTFAFLVFSGMLASIGFWALRNLKRDKKTSDRLRYRGTGISLTIR
jgi:hypothetical protein